MAESQNIEWKELWQDEYLKWICGFANAQGGRIYIGRQDDGTVVGVDNSKKLLETLPNKIQNNLGQHRTNSAKNVCLVAIDKKHSPPLIFLRRGKPN